MKGRPRSKSLRPCAYVLHDGSAVMKVRPGEQRLALRQATQSVQLSARLPASGVVWLGAPVLVFKVCQLRDSLRATILRGLYRGLGDYQGLLAVLVKLIQVLGASAGSVDSTLLEELLLAVHLAGGAELLPPGLSQAYRPRLEPRLREAICRPLSWIGSWSSELAGYERAEQCLARLEAHPQLQVLCDALEGNSILLECYVRGRRLRAAFAGGDLTFSPRRWAAHDAEAETSGMVASFWPAWRFQADPADLSSPEEAALHARESFLDALEGAAAVLEASKPEQQVELDPAGLADRSALASLLRSGILKLPAVSADAEAVVDALSSSRSKGSLKFEVSPRLDASPEWTLFEALAAGLETLELRLAELLGTAQLEAVDMLGPGGKQRRSLGDALSESARLLRGAAALARSQLGAGDTAPGAIEFAERWAQQAVFDFDVGGDIRRIVRTDQGFQAVLGWRSVSCELYYRSSPSLSVRDAQGRSVRPKEVAVRLAKSDLVSWTPVVIPARLENPGLIDPAAFQQACDAIPEAEALIARLAVPG